MTQNSQISLDPTTLHGLGTKTRYLRFWHTFSAKSKSVQRQIYRWHSSPPTQEKLFMHRYRSAPVFSLSTQLENKNWRVPESISPHAIMSISENHQINW